MIKPIEVKAIEKYKVWVKFSDGVQGELDLSHLAGKPVFKFWDEGDEFYKAYIHPLSDAVTWKEDVDIDPLNMYLKITGKKFEDVNYY